MSSASVKSFPIVSVAQRLGIDIRNNKAFCFNGHDSKSPSLSFETKKNFFHCFGCGVGGSAIDLVMSVRRVSFSEAVSWLETEYSVNSDSKRHKTISYSQSHKSSKIAVSVDSESVRDDLRDVRHEVYSFFLSLLDFGEACEYLGGRGIDSDIVQRAGIRALSTDSRATKKQLFGEFGIETLRAVGLIVNDRLAFEHHRLIIPYLDEQSQLVNLQGRDIDKSSQIKYRFLGGAPVTLYNEQTLKTMNDNAIVYLCEGVLDVLSCYQLGLLNPVGVAGVNNFKPHHSERLKRYSVIVASDSDNAGNDFYLRVVRGFQPRGVSRIDFDRLCDSLNVDRSVNDLNDIATTANISARSHYSEVVNEYYTRTSGGIRFASGEFYTGHELKKISGLGPADVRQIYSVKRTFRGLII